jgi:hypothetical protein
MQLHRSARDLIRRIGPWWSAAVLSAIPTLIAAYQFVRGSHRSGWFFLFLAALVWVVLTLVAYHSLHVELDRLSTGASPSIGREIAEYETAKARYAGMARQALISQLTGKGFSTSDAAKKADEEIERAEGLPAATSPRTPSVVADTFAEQMSEIRTTKQMNRWLRAHWKRGKVIEYEASKPLGAQGIALSTIGFSFRTYPQIADWILQLHTAAEIHLRDDAERFRTKKDDEWLHGALPPTKPQALTLLVYKLRKLDELLKEREGTDGL